LAESPSIFEKGAIISVLDPSASRARQKATSKVSQNQMENEILDSDMALGENSNIISQIGGEEENSSHQRVNSGLCSNINQMQSIPQSSVLSAYSTHKGSNNNQQEQSNRNIRPVIKQLQQMDHAASSIKTETVETAEERQFIPEKSAEHDANIFVKPKMTLMRSQSEYQLRDREFYEMCDDEDEVVLYCKMADRIAEQTIISSMHDHIHRNLSQRNNQNDVKNRLIPNNILINQPKLAKLSNNNQLVFMSQQTFNQFNQFQHYLQGKEKTQSGQITQLALGNATGDQNSSQQQTRGKGTFNRLIGGIQNTQNLHGPSNLNNVSNYLGTNFLTASLDDGTLPMYNQLMLPSHQYSRQTLLMMQNLHNNYLYSANAGTLFTQRGYNSGPNGLLQAKSGTIGGSVHQIGQSMSGLTNIGNIHKDLINRNASVSDSRGATTEVGHTQINGAALSNRL